MKFNNSLAPIKSIARTLGRQSVHLASPEEIGDTFRHGLRVNRGARGVAEPVPSELCSNCQAPRSGKTGGFSGVTRGPRNQSGTQVASLRQTQS